MTQGGVTIQAVVCGECALCASLLFLRHPLKYAELLCEKSFGCRCSVFDVRRSS